MSAMTKNALHILLSLADGPQHGYAIKQDIDARTDGDVRLGAGTLYETIQRLERNGWIREVNEPRGAEEASGPPRRFYTLTRAGRNALRAELERFASVVRFARRRNLLPEAR